MSTVSVRLGPVRQRADGKMVVSVVADGPFPAFEEVVVDPSMDREQLVLFAIEHGIGERPIPQLSGMVDVDEAKLHAALQRRLAALTPKPAAPDPEPAEPAEVEGTAQSGSVVEPAGGKKGSK